MLVPAKVVILFSMIYYEASLGLELTKDDLRIVARVPKHVAIVSASLRNCDLRHECRMCENKRDDINNKNLFCIPGQVCRQSLFTRPLQQSVKICHQITKKVCPEQHQCKQCPIFCRPNKQIWCEDTFKIIQRVKEERVCDESGFCATKKRISDDISPGRRCYEKELEPLCATIDCRFQTIQKDCVHTTKTINVTLVEEECDICEQSSSSNLKKASRETCTSSVMRPCSNNSFHGKWIKTCQDKTVTKITREPRHNHENEVLPLIELFDMASSPVRALLNRTSPLQTAEDMTSTTENTPFNMEHLVVLNERVLVTKKTTVQPETREEELFIVAAQSVSDRTTEESPVYFDPMNNVRRRTTITTTTTTAATTTTTTAATASTTTSLSHRKPKVTNITETTTTEVPEPTETTLTTTIEITAAIQARLCLYKGICDSNTARKYFHTSTLPPTTTTTTTTTTAPTTVETETSTAQINWAILAQIQRCIQTPTYCNTNLIPTSQKRRKEGTNKQNEDVTSTAEIFTESPTTTTSTTTEQQQHVEQPRSSSLRLRVRLCLFNNIC